MQDILLRETPKVLTTTPFGKLNGGTRLIAEPNGNNVRNWAIRSVISYVRYDKDMESIQRLNGCWSIMTV
jgi:hypothetical protein